MTKPTRSWSGSDNRTSCRVEVNNLWRGTIRTAGVQDTTGPGLAGHLIWRVSTYDGIWLEPIASNYVDAEKALLEATTELER